jgi:hypothetical protein
MNGDESLFIYKNITITKSQKGNESVHVYGLCTCIWVVEDPGFWFWRSIIFFQKNKIK